MNKRTRIFGEPLRKPSKKQQFNLEVSKDMISTLQSTEIFDNSLPSPTEFIEKMRIEQNLSLEETFALTSSNQLEKGWFWTVNYVAVHEVALGVNAAVGATTVAAAATIAAVALGVVGDDPKKDKQLYKKMNNAFLSKLSSESLKQGGFFYLNEVLKEFTLLVKNYNREGKVYEI